LGSVTSVHLDLSHTGDADLLFPILEEILFAEVPEFPRGWTGTRCMTHPFSHRFAAAVVVALLAPLAHAQGDAAAGKSLYAARCASCHSLQFNSVGPTHKNLIGRRAGSAAGYAYSPALKESTVVWSEDTLSRWLADPEKFIPGQRMFISIPDAKERADIVAYLQLVAGPQATTPAKLEK
jgi:cytochrome c